MPTALVLCAADPASDPRPNRMIRCLARDFDVTVVSRGAVDIPGVQCVRIPDEPRRSPGRRLANIVRLARGHFRQLVWVPGLREIAARERARPHAFIAVHDLRLLPVALAIRGRRGRVLFDAREYYARHYENLWWWRWLYQPFNRSLCRHYLRRADAMVTVSAGLAAEYAREFGVSCGVLPSLPASCDLQPQPVAPDAIRLVHHGLASPSRRLEGMIEMMRHLPSRFTLDMFLMPADRRYVDQLSKLAARRPGVRVLPPQPFKQLVSATNAYDIGVFLVPPASFNLRFALPNKFFEFVQSRLMIAIGPSPEMAGYVDVHDLGVVAADFSPATLAAAMAKLTSADVWRYKQNAHRAAAVLNSDQTDSMLRAIALGKPRPTALA